MKTPLYDRHVALGARMAPFAGWEMPIQYEGILAEHLHTRASAALFDICHMGEFDLQGPTAEADLERLVTQPLSTLSDGQCRYGFLCAEDGGVIDDLTVYRRAPEHFMLVVNAGTLEKDAAWIQSHLSVDTVFTDLTPDTAKLDVQGPRSREALEEVLGHALPGLKYFRFTEMDLAGAPCTISRTGYTGEWGYELYFPMGETGRIWDLLVNRSDMKPAGLGARDTLRLEVGYPLYGSELSGDRTPVAAVGNMFMDLDKKFIGKEAILRDLENGVPRGMAGLRLAGKRAARAHDKVFVDGAEVGEITSGSLSPSLEVAVAMAYLDVSRIEPGTPVEIEIRGKHLPAEVVELPFYKDGTARSQVSGFS